MRKLYKYRPLSELLFKELYYQELYFASYPELNDPLDLSARIEFTVDHEYEIDYLVHFIFKTTLKLSGEDTFIGRDNNKSLLQFIKDKVSLTQFKRNIYNKLAKLKGNQIWLHDIENILREEDVHFVIDFISFKKELQRLSQVFLESSYTTCFSEVNNDFLLWSHYASKHAGICLEFSLEHSMQFPYKKSSTRETNKDRYLERSSIWNTQELLFWTSIKKVQYQTEQPFINFFKFFPVFQNEQDCDLMGLSKSWTHSYAQQLEWVFSTKTTPWSYEKEWRSIEVNFGDIKEPEERIRHYPIEALSAIYFGVRTPEGIKKRISNIFKAQKKDILFYDSELTNDRCLDFKIWKIHE